MLGKIGTEVHTMEGFLMWSGEEGGHTWGYDELYLCLLCSAAWLHPHSKLSQNWTLITLLSLIGYGLYGTNQ